MPSSSLQVLEGFVLMALDTPLTELQPLLEAYETVVAPARPAALAGALRLGEACRTRAAWLIERLDSCSGAAEPRRIEGFSGASVWEVACESGDARQPCTALFRTLRALYAHRVVLKAYEYKGSLQVRLQQSRPSEDRTQLSGRHSSRGELICA